MFKFNTFRKFTTHTGFGKGSGGNKGDNDLLFFTVGYVVGIVSGYTFKC
jgi:hypothetical protein